MSDRPSKAAMALAEKIYDDAVAGSTSEHWDSDDTRDMKERIARLLDEHVKDLVEGCETSAATFWLEQTSPTTCRAHFGDFKVDCDLVNTPKITIPRLLGKARRPCKAALDEMREMLQTAENILARGMTKRGKPMSERERTRLKMVIAEERIRLADFEALPE